MLNGNSSMAARMAAAQRLGEPQPWLPFRVVW